MGFFGLNKSGKHLSKSSAGTSPTFTTCDSKRSSPRTRITQAIACLNPEGQEDSLEWPPSSPAPVSGEGGAGGEGSTAESGTVSLEQDEEGRAAVPTKTEKDEQAAPQSIPRSLKMKATARMLQFRAQRMQKIRVIQDGEQEQQELNLQLQPQAQEADLTPLSSRPESRELSLARWDSSGFQAPLSGEEVLDKTSLPRSASAPGASCTLSTSGSFTKGDQGSIRKSVSLPAVPHKLEVMVFLEAVQGSGDIGHRRSAAEKLRALSRVSETDRCTLGMCGAVPVLVELLVSEDDIIVTHAVTTLLNLGLEPSLKLEIGGTPAVPKLVHLMKTSQVKEIRENAAGALCNLSVAEQNCPILRQADTIPPLVELLKANESLTVRRDAVAGLYNMAIDQSSREDIVELGTVQVVLEILKEAHPQLDNEAVKLLGRLMKVPEACAIVEEEGGLIVLVDILEDGSQRAQASAVAAILLFAESSEGRQKLVTREGIVPSLKALSECGSRRAREKASLLLKLLRGW